MQSVLKMGLAAATLAAAVTASIGARADESVLGVWLDHTGRGAVEITDCGDAVCGKVVWVGDEANAKGCGLQILGDVKPVGDGTFDGGWIYDPDRDAKFDVELAPQAGGKLTVVGYKGIKLFSETFTWTRAPDNLQRCSS